MKSRRILSIILTIAICSAIFLPTASAGTLSRAQIAMNLMNSSIAYHLKGHYTTAANGYSTILKAQNIHQNQRNTANVYLQLSKRGSDIIRQKLVKNNYYTIVDANQKKFKSQKLYSGIVSFYYTSGRYFGRISKQQYLNTKKKYHFDKNGIPMVMYNKKYYYNYVAIEEYALLVYGQYLDGNAKKEEFLNIANWLAKNMDSRGAYVYKFPYQNILKPGWVSAMAQGQALSVFARAYRITNDKYYIQSGNKAFKFLTTPVLKGGVMDTLGGLDKRLSKYIYFQEYVTKPASYTLNGYMFSLIGIYDWTQVKANDANTLKLANSYFNSGLKTLKYILPYYDLGGFTSYDLKYLTSNAAPHVDPTYHSVHLQELQVLYLVTKDKDLEYYRRLWYSYID